MSIFAEATKRAATARFKQKDVDAEGQEIEVIDKGLMCESFLCSTYRMWAFVRYSV